MILSHERPSIVFPLARFVLPPSIVALSRSVSCLVLSPSPGICLSCREKQTTGPSRGPLPCYMGLALGRRHHNSITSLVGHMAVGHWTTIENHIAEKSSLCSWSLLLSIIFGIFCTNFVAVFSGFCQNPPSTLNRPKLGEILIFVFSAVVKLKFQYFLPLGRL